MKPYGGVGRDNGLGSVGDVEEPVTYPLLIREGVDEVATAFNRDNDVRRLDVAAGGRPHTCTGLG
jgi:hypothetical protein